MKKRLLGFDIGGTKCAAILGEAEGDQIRIEEKRVFATASVPRPEDCIARFILEAEKMLSDHPGSLVESIGISCGGPLDSRRGVIQSPPNLPGWDEVPICEILDRHFHLPVRSWSTLNSLLHQDTP